MIEQPLRTTPISEVTMNHVSEVYVKRVYWYLKHVLKCEVENLGPMQGHKIIFPRGTVEEIYAGQSTQWTHRTTLRFPTGQTLTKYVSVDLPLMNTSTTMLAFPNTLLEGPEPPEK